MSLSGSFGASDVLQSQAQIGPHPPLTATYLICSAGATIGGVAFDLNGASRGFTITIPAGAVPAAGNLASTLIVAQLPSFTALSARFIAISSGIIVFTGLIADYVVGMGRSVQATATLEIGPEPSMEQIQPFLIGTDNAIAAGIFDVGGTRGNVVAGDQNGLGGFPITKQLTPFSTTTSGAEINLVLVTDGYWNTVGIHVSATDASVAATVQGSNNAAFTNPVTLPNYGGANFAVGTSVAAVGTYLYNVSGFKYVRINKSAQTAGTYSGNVKVSTAVLGMQPSQNLQQTLLASAAQTTLQSSADQTNANYNSVLVHLNVTAASGTGGLTVRIQAKDAIGNYHNINAAPAAVIATGQTTYVLGPACNSTGGEVVQATPAHLPLTWRISVTVGDASSYTYSVCTEVGI